MVPQGAEKLATQWIEHHPILESEKHQRTGCPKRKMEPIVNATSACTIDLE